MVKYLATLELLAPRFGTERLPVCHLELPAQAVGEPYYIRDGGQAPPEPGPELATGPPTHEVLVTGTGGIQWRPIQAEVSRVPPPSSGPSRAGAGAPAQLWPWPPRGTAVSLFPTWLWAMSVCPLGWFFGECPLSLPLGDLISGVCTSEESLSGIWGCEGPALPVFLPEVLASGVWISWGRVPIPSVTQTRVGMPEERPRSLQLWPPPRENVWETKRA